MRRFIAAALMPLLFATSHVVAKEKAGKVPKDLQPITMQLRWGMVRYSAGVTGLDRYKNLQPYIDRLGDAEASRTVDQARRINRSADFFGFVGTAGVVWGLGTLWWGHDKHWKRPEVSWPLFSGLALELVSGAIRNAAESKKFEAVQRFNSVVRGEQKLSWDFGTDGRMASTGLRYRF